MWRAVPPTPRWPWPQPHWSLSTAQWRRVPCRWLLKRGSCPIRKWENWLFLRAIPSWNPRCFGTWCLYWCPTAMDEFAWLWRWVFTWRMLHLGLIHLQVLKEAAEIGHWPNIWGCPSRLPPRQPPTQLRCSSPRWPGHWCGCTRTTRWWRTSPAEPRSWRTGRLIPVPVPSVKPPVRPLSRWCKKRGTRCGSKPGRSRGSAALPAAACGFWRPPAGWWTDTLRTPPPRSERNPSRRVGRTDAGEFRLALRHDCDS